MNIFSVCEQKNFFLHIFFLSKLLSMKLQYAKTKYSGNHLSFFLNFYFYLFFSPSECLNLKVMFLQNVFNSFLDAYCHTHNQTKRTYFNNCKLEEIFIFRIIKFLSSKKYFYRRGVFVTSASSYKEMTES